MKNTFWTAGEKVKNIYEKLNNTRKHQFGSYKKCIFHLHTPVSYDYKCSKTFATDNDYKEKVRKIFLT